MRYAAALALAAACADAAGITEVTTRTFEAETSKGDPLHWCSTPVRPPPTTGTDAPATRREQRRRVFDRED